MKASEGSGRTDRIATPRAAMTGALGGTGRQQDVAPRQEAGRKQEAARKQEPRGKREAAQATASVPAAAKAAAPKPAKPKAAPAKAAAPESAPSKPAKAALATAAKPKLEKIVPERQLPEALAVEPPAPPTMATPTTTEIPTTATPAAAKGEAAVVARPAGFAAPAQEAAPVPQAEPERRPAMPAEAERRANVNDRNPPRIPSKAENFVAGDHVVYPTHGVGKVERIAVEEIAGHSLELIHITFEENRMTLRVPVAKARSAGLRKLASRKMFDEALAVLKGRARIKRTMWSRRAQEYEAKINSGDPLAIAEVVRDLHRNAGQPDQSFSERQIYEAAMDRLAAELGALDKTDKATAATKLANFLKTVA